MTILFVVIKLALFVAAVMAFVQTPVGKKLGKYLPTPFWIYFFSIACGHWGLLPSSSPEYKWIGLHLLPSALILMLIGTPVMMIFKMGPKALLAIILATGTMFIGALVSFVVFQFHLPDEGWKMAGTMLGTWTGGSANMLAVKETLDLSNAGYGPLLLADTFLSYGWLALLMMGVAYQVWFDKRISDQEKINFDIEPSGSPLSYQLKNIPRFTVVLLAGFVLAELMIVCGGVLNEMVGFLSKKAWAILLSCTTAVLLALTQLKNLERWRASDIGTFLLYMVLASMGAKTNLKEAISDMTPIYFAALMILIHGSLLFSLGRLFKLPLFLLATASQANVGGPVSAPIVASVYCKGAAQVGVLMAIFGSVLGTYVGALGGWLCKMIAF